MRVHIEIDDDLVAEIDRVAGARSRSRFVRDAIVAALERRQRAAALQAGLGAIPDRGHEWDLDPARWVRAQRRDDTRRVG